MGICKFINDTLAWFMEVDGRRMVIANKDDCDYLATKYQSMGYTIEWDRDLYKRKEDAVRVDNVIRIINQMSRVDMCRLHRFAPPGHPWFDTSLPFHDVFMKRFNELGGFNPIISKELGWENSPECSKL